MGYVFALCEMDGTPIGEIVKPYERKLVPQINGLPTAQVRLRLDDPLVDEIFSRDGDVLLKVYLDSVLKFCGDLLTADENGGWYRRLLSREGLVNIAYVLPTNFEGGVTTAGEIGLNFDAAAITARGTFEEVIPADFDNFLLRQALAENHVAIRKSAREIVTFDPSTPPSNQPPSVMCNFAGGLWRLQKRLLGVPYPNVIPTWADVPADEIIRQMLDQQNANGVTGIREGTFDVLYATDYGPEYFKPMAEALANLQESKVAFPVGIPPVYDAQDEFTQPGTFPNWMDGEIATDTTAWDTSHTGTAATDFDIFDAGDYAHRSAAGDTSYSTGRFAISGTGNHTAVVVGIDYQLANGYTTGYDIYGGVVARYVDQSNWLMALFDLQNNIFFMRKKVAGADPSWETFTFNPGGIAASTRYAIRLFVDELGNYAAWHYAPAIAGPGAPIFQGRDPVFATGGALETGKVGFYDAMTTGVAADRNYYSFFAADYTGPQSFDFEVAPLDIGVGGETDIGELNIRYRIGTTTPTAVFEHGAPTPVCFVDYEAGDDVIGRAVSEQDSVRFNGTFRIEEAEISIDDHDRVKEVPQLIP